MHKNISANADGSWSWEIAADHGRMLRGYPDDVKQDMVDVAASVRGASPTEAEAHRAADDEMFLWRED